MKLFTDFFEPFGAFQMLARTGHILAGVTWIGILYFFNFVQVPAFAELSDGARSEALRKLTFRALWWFRYAALLTFLFGIALVGVYSSEDGSNYLEGARGTAILTGMLLGITMFLNVWGVIWRNQKIVIGNAETVAAGGTANPEAATAAKRGARASRCNTFFSVPMLYFMVFAAHGGSWFGLTTESTTVYWIITLVVWAFVEASALGLIGGLDSAFNKAVFDKHQTTIWGSFALFVVMILLWEVLLAV